MPGSPHDRLGRLLASFPATSQNPHVQLARDVAIFLDGLDRGYLGNPSFMQDTVESVLIANLRKGVAAAAATDMTRSS